MGCEWALFLKAVAHIIYEGARTKLTPGVLQDPNRMRGTALGIGTHSV